MNSERMTIQKKIIKDAVMSCKNHPSAETIYNLIAKNHPNISKATVYRNLNMMAEAGEIRRVEIPDSPDRYDYINFPHYHIKCQICGKIFNVNMKYMDRLNRELQDKSGFEILEHSIVFKGICPDCKLKKP